MDIELNQGIEEDNITYVRKLEQRNSGSNRMKQIFRNLKNDNKNKNNDTQDLRGNPMREKTTDGGEHNQSTI